jgi:hypothetical protein
LSQSAIHTLLGFLLFVTGLIALFAVSSPPPSAATPQEPTTPPPSMVGDVDLIEGIGPEVEQVFLEGGTAEVLGADAMSQIPPEVARILVENGVVLTIPDGGNP